MGWVFFLWRHRPLVRELCDAANTVLSLSRCVLVNPRTDYEIVF